MTKKHTKCSMLWVIKEIQIRGWDSCHYANIRRANTVVMEPNAETLDHSSIPAGMWNGPAILQSSLTVL
jgi:hypothetical protein